MNKYFLGIDNGGTVSKAALFDIKGNIVLKKSVTVPFSVNDSGKTERSQKDIIDKNIELIRQIAAAADGEIAGIGLSGHGKGLYLLDKKGAFLGGGIGSTDGRALCYQELWENDGTAKKAAEKTCQKTLACQPVSLLRWLKDNDRETYDRVGAVLSINDLVGYGLTGKVYTERTEISGTGLVNLKTNSYDRELLELFGIPEVYDALPEIISSFDIRGGITKEVAAYTGLKEGTPVTGGMFDIDACALAAGTKEPGDMCMIAGTWTINEYVSEAPVPEISMNSYFCVPGLYLAEESSACSAGNLDGMRQYLKEYSYDELDRMVEETKAEESDVYFTPFLFASNLNPYAKSSLIGLDSSSTMGDIARAIYEGVAYSGYTHMEKLLAGAKKAPEFIRLAGGIANSPVWIGIFADLIGIPLLVSKCPELGCKGAAMTAGIAAGVYDSIETAVAENTAESFIVSPDLSKTAVYRRKYGVYRDIEASMAGCWKKIRNL